jgi:integrase
MPSYEQNKDSKLWSVRFRELGEDGLQHQKRLSGFKTKRAAQLGYEDYVIEQDKKATEVPPEPEKPDPNAMPFSELVKRYLDYLAARTRESTVQTLSNKIGNRITPYFGDRPLSTITPAVVLEWMHSLNGYSDSYIKDLFVQLKAVYAFGAKYHDVTNVMLKVDSPRARQQKKEMLFWELEEFETFIKHVDQNTYRLFFCTLYFTGCRRGEGHALLWEDIDLTARTIRINKSMTNKTSNGPYEITAPKNASSVRTVPIPSYLCDALAEYKASLPPEYAQPKSFAFGGDRPLPAKSTDRAFSKACAASGVKQIRIHDLRHSCASLLISRGVSIVAVSKRLGHATIEQTLETYTHLLADDQAQMIAALEDLGTNLGTKK